MPFSTAQRLQSLGVATPLARELGAQIDSGTYNYRRLMWSGMPVQLAQIVATTPFNAIKAVELGMIPDVARIRGGGGGQPYVPVGILMDGFETTSAWSQVSSKTASVDTVNKVQGVASSKYSPSATSVAIQINKDFANFDAASLETYAFYVNLGDDIDWQATNTVGFNFLINGGGTVYPGASKTVQANVAWGGIWLSGNVNRMNPAVAAAGVGNHRIRNLTTETNANVGEVSFDALYRAVGASTKGAMILTCDDIPIQQYTVLFPELQARGLVAELYVPTSLVGTTNKMTQAQIMEMASAGCSIQINGTPDDTVMTTFSNVSDWVTNGLNLQRGIISSWGLPTPISFCYTFGYLRHPGTTVLKTGVTLTSGANTMTIADVTGIVNGQRVVAKGLTKAATVVSVVGTTVTISEPFAFTSSTAQAVNFVTVTSDFHGTKPQLAAIAAGYKWGRATVGNDMFIGYGISRAQSMQFPSTTVTGMTLANFTALVDQAVAAKSVTSVYIHTAVDWPDRVACLDYLKSQIDLGLIECTTTPALEAKYGAATVPA